MLWSCVAQPFTNIYNDSKSFITIWQILHELCTDSDFSKALNAELPNPMIWGVVKNICRSTNENGSVAKSEEEKTL